jgi:transcriptional regulator with XRE-family HTH domain
MSKQKLHNTMGVQNDDKAEKLIRKPGIGRGKTSTGSFPEYNRTQIAAKLGVHKSTISNVLSGRRDLSETNEAVVAQAMGIELDRFRKELTRVRKRNGIAPRKRRGLQLANGK